jgi:hypothetical protein
MEQLLAFAIGLNIGAILIHHFGHYAERWLDNSLL